MKIMNASQESKLNMSNTVTSHLEENAAVIAENVAFQNAFDRLKTNLTAIDENAERKALSLSGISADKTNHKQTLCRLAAELAGVIYAYATATANETLKQEMNLSHSKLERTRDAELAPRCQTIHDRGTTHLNDLKNYGITAAKLTALQTAIDGYAAATPKPRDAASHRKTATTNLAALFKENDKILNGELDKLIELFRLDHPDLVETYWATRIIIDPAAKSKEGEDGENK